MATISSANSGVNSTSSIRRSGLMTNATSTRSSSNAGIGSSSGTISMRTSAPGCCARKVRRIGGNHWKVVLHCAAKRT